jgi:hypothetical protein
LKEDEDKDNDIDLPKPLTKVDDVCAILEEIDDYSLRKFGDSGCPLAYVVRDTVALPNAADDPGFGMPTYSAEMIARAPHTGVSFERDAMSVWNLIRHVCHGGFAWNWVSWDTQ